MHSQFETELGISLILSKIRLWREQSSKCATGESYGFKSGIGGGQIRHPPHTTQRSAGSEKTAMCRLSLHRFHECQRPLSSGM